MTQGARERVRAGLVLLLLGAWSLRWTTGQTALGTAIQDGPERTGVLGAVLLLALWGLAATALLAERPAGLVRGAALTDLFVAGVGALEAPTVFVPLAALALVQVALDVRRPALGAEVGIVRGGAALACAALLALDGAGAPALLAGWLALSALVVAVARGRGGVRRRLEALLLVLAAAALSLPSAVASWSGGEQHGVYEGLYGWYVVSAVLLLFALQGVGRRSSPR